VLTHVLDVSFSFFVQVLPLLNVIVGSLTLESPKKLLVFYCNFKELILSLIPI
jgi:hypothetical protein